ncbi:hypothetical protein [Neorhodopirellula pilleata]|uniref:Lipoprotein n=1 Tax=Neorhodopirellula pilleata TaxID=2714738 RepID=A0A5C5ZZP8_9BACT|nr:hypothetical protein [Neorhodopirellula pilleata]TWT93044.1 hypothetical protein Pla100_43600 [Neorhodopirellula pilleata]
MSIRTFTIVTLVIVTSSATGCGGMRNFLFGRGAQCGLCNRIGAVGNAINPLAPAPGIAPSTCGAPPSRGCGLFNRNPAPVYAPPVACSPVPCGDECVGSGYGYGGYVDGGYVSGMPGDCQTCAPYGGYESGAVHDPYLSAPVIGNEYPVDGYSGGGIPSEGWYQRPTTPYGARKFDSQGDEIISESPLPPGARFAD